MLQKLSNPKTQNYFAVKQLINDETFPWFYLPNSVKTKDNYPGHTNHPTYVHTFLERPWNNMTKLYPEIRSASMEYLGEVFAEIARENNFTINCLLRASVNCIEPVDNPQLSIPHIDHDFSHKNLVVYLNDAGGETVVYNDDGTFEEHHPKEDDAIIFSGLHCYRPSSTKRRLVLVTTYI